MKHEELIKKMTLEEKASLTSGKDFWQTMDIPHLGIKSMFLSDGPHGIRKQAAAADHLGLNESLPATCFPTSATIANSFDVDLAKEVGHALGEEAVALKVNVVLGPGLNIKRNPRCGRNFEYYSEDPYLAGKLAANYVNGIQSNGIGSCIKHFACNNQEERRLSSNSIVDERALREIYTEAFEITIKEAKPKCVMSSYNLVNDVYANENDHLLKDILRDEFKFEGVVVTDWGGDNDRIAGLKATNEIEMPGNNGETDQEIVDAIKNNKLDEKVLDEAVDRILTLNEETSKYLEKDTKIDVDAHHEIARKAAQGSIVLLKNNEETLPLNNTEKVCVIGDFAKKARYQGAGSSIVNPTKLDNFMDLIKDYDINFIGFEPGYNRYGKTKKGLAKQALRLATHADKIIYFMGLDEVTEAEGLDRENIKIKQNQIDLLKALKALGKKIIVILNTGSAVDLRFDDDADALLYTCLYGQAGARATLDILVGDVNPSGHLSETYAMCYENTPTAKYFPEHTKNSYYKDSIFVGYRYFDKVEKEVKYPFGYGLSYTKFKYDNLKVGQDGVRFTIKNVGDRTGKDVAQLYVGLPVSEVFRPAKELKGFIKVELKPNEEKEVFIPFDEYTFRFFNVNSNKFEVESGNYNLLIGNSSRDIYLKGEIMVKGNFSGTTYNKDDLKDYYKGEIQDISNETFEKLVNRPLPSQAINFVKKNRINVDYNTTVTELRYARGWTGRVFSRGVRTAIKVLKFFGNKVLANTLIMGLLHQPMRGLSRMTNGAISMKQLDGLIKMFNGHFHKGFAILIKAGKLKPKVPKEKRYHAK